MTAPIQAPIAPTVSATEVAISELVQQWVHGGTPSTKDTTLWGGDLPWITSADIVDQRMVEPRRFLSTQGRAHSNAHVAPRGSVLVTTRTGLGKVALAPCDVAISQDITALVVDAGRALGGFVYWYLATTPNLLSRLRQGTSIGGIVRDDLASLRLPLQLISDQAKVIAVLDAIDDAIDKTRAVIDATARVREALLEELLTCGVRVRHGQRESSPQVGRLSPGWSVCRVGDLVERIEAGVSYLALGRAADDSEWGVLKVSSVSWGEFRGSENKALPPGSQVDDRLEVQSGDILVSRSNTPELVGRCVMVQAARPRLLLSDKTLRLIPKISIVEPQFLSLALSAQSARRQIESLATGSSRSMRNISQDRLRSVFLPLPPFIEQRKIVGAVMTVVRTVDVDTRRLDALRTVKSRLAAELLRV